jgi:hypothetical protein
MNKIKDQKSHEEVSAERDERNPEKKHARFTAMKINARKQN